MKKRRLFILIGSIIIIVAILVFFIINVNTNNSTIPDGYIAVFHGGSGEIVFETYIYKEDNDHYNFGFKYINVTKITESYGSSKWKTRVTKKGYVQWTDDVFEIAKKHGAYSYVTEPNSTDTYSIEQFRQRFIMN